MTSMFHIGDLNTPLPSDGIVVDTSYILEAHQRDGSTITQSDCTNPANRLAANRIPIVVLSCKIMELRHVIKRSMCLDQCKVLGRAEGEWEDVFDSDAGLKTQVNNEIYRVESVIMASDSSFEFIEATEGREVLELSRFI